jgi:hypothetical protein
MEIERARRETMQGYIYSFDFGEPGKGELTATRYPANYCVGGDWVCFAADEVDALYQAHIAAENEWGAPDDDDPHNFRVTFWTDKNERLRSPARSKILAAIEAAKKWIDENKNDAFEYVYRE